MRMELRFVKMVDGVHPVALTGPGPLELHVTAGPGQSVLFQIEERDGTLHCHAKGTGHTRLTTMTPVGLVDLTEPQGEGDTP